MSELFIVHQNPLFLVSLIPCCRYGGYVHFGQKKGLSIIPPRKAYVEVPLRVDEKRRYHALMSDFVSLDSQASSQDRKSLMSEIFLLFPSTSDVVFVKPPSHCQECPKDHSKTDQEFGKFPVLGKILHVSC